MEDYDYWIMEAMQTHGGSFVQQLAILMGYADRNNLRKIKDTWKDEIKEFERFGKILKEKDKGD